MPRKTLYSLWSISLLPPLLHVYSYSWILLRVFLAVYFHTCRPSYFHREAKCKRAHTNNLKLRITDTIRQHARTRFKSNLVFFSRGGRIYLAEGEKVSKILFTSCFTCTCSQTRVNKYVGSWYVAVSVRRMNISLLKGQREESFFFFSRIISRWKQHCDFSVTEILWGNLKL